MRCVGLDLAWGERATTGAVALDDGRMIAWKDDLTDDDDVLGWIAHVDTGGPLQIAIDAPTHVPNETGRRPCEAQIAAAFRDGHAGPLPSNRRLLAHPTARSGGSAWWRASPPRESSTRRSPARAARASRSIRTRPISCCSGGATSCR